MTRLSRVSKIEQSFDGRYAMKKLLFLFVVALPLFAQSNVGELRLRVTDAAGLGVKSSVILVSEANQLHKSLVTGDSGSLIVEKLPFGVYRIEVRREGFAPLSATLEIRSAIPLEYHVTLNVASQSATVTVTDAGTLIDPFRTGTINRIGSEAIEDRPASLPGRSLVDLVNSQPGWLYEGNAVLHPRGSEYQTQFIVDGIPLTDNRSPGIGTELDADDVQSVTIYTADIPAEYGRKLGGVVEVVTARDSRSGLHGEVDASGGSFGTADGYASAQYGLGRNTFFVSADGAHTGRYLNPPVTQNFTNAGTTADFASRYERDFSDSDRLTLSVWHEQARFLVPNEQVQQQAGQRQDRDNYETMGIASYQHIFSPDIVGELHGMVRDDSADLSSNPFSTPIIADQQRGFREGYFKASLAVHHGRHEWKTGVESDATSIHEAFSDVITDPSQFDPRTPPTFSFLGRKMDVEQSAFAQDLIRFGKWTVSAGIRWDHYQLVVNQNAVSPRLGVARYWKKAEVVFHASYDRVFETPAFENILLASSPDVVALNPNVLRLPVEPSHGNYYEAGLTKGFFGNLKLDVNYFRRDVNNFADDDQLLNTSVSFPIAFRSASIYGAEGKIDIPHWGGLSGFVSYSYSVGSAYFPVTGGLFLGDDATNAATHLSGRFWISQDQRNTLRTRFRYQLTKKLWLAAGGEYGSGLPFDFNGTKQQALDQLGSQVVDRVNFSRGRVRPSLSINAAAGADIWKNDKAAIRVQAGVENLNDRLNLIDFAGLFSGTSIAPPRSYSIRLQTSF